jgi:hypothetical protein
VNWRPKHEAAQVDDPILYSTPVSRSPKDIHASLPYSFELFSGISSHLTVFFSHNDTTNSNTSHNKPAKRTDYLSFHPLLALQQKEKCVSGHGGCAGNYTTLMHMRLINAPNSIRPHRRGLVTRSAELVHLGEHAAVKPWRYRDGR